jgi:crotonobetainyl-CoA:carnitine CoA-transferase CaiB-like acyl-CoA transferase
VVLDLRDEASRPAIEKLIRWADVLVDGFRPGVMKRLGCDWETASALNPRLVYCSISAYGQEGPRAQEPGHDLNLQALTGVCDLERDRDGSPRGTVLPVADLSTSLIAVASITAALVNRKEGGRYLDVAMADGVLSWSELWALGLDLTGPVRQQVGSSGVLGAPIRRMLDEIDRRKLYAMPHYDLYQCRDGWIAVGIVDENHFWKSLCDVMGLRLLRGLDLQKRTAMGPVIRPILRRLFRRKTLSHWLVRLKDAGVPASRVSSAHEAKRDAQFTYRDMFDEAGRVRAPLPGAVHLAGRAPKLGEHTESVLAELGSKSRP